MKIVLFYVIGLLIALIDYQYYAYRNKCKVKLSDYGVILGVIVIASPIIYFMVLIHDGREGFYLNYNK